MSEGSEFQTEGTAILKLREAKVVRTRGTDNRLVLEQRSVQRTCWNVATKKRTKISGLRGAGVLWVSVASLNLMR